MHRKEVSTVSGVLVDVQQPLQENQLWIVVFAHYHGVNTLNMADTKLPVLKLALRIPENLAIWAGRSHWLQWIDTLRYIDTLRQVSIYIIGGSILVGLHVHLLMLLYIMTAFRVQLVHRTENIYSLALYRKFADFYLRGIRVYCSKSCHVSAQNLSH